MNPRTCTIDGCDRLHHGRGWCYAHYLRWWRHGDLLLRLLPRPTAAERFWSQVDKGDGTGCWLWTGAGAGDGYGGFSVGSRTDGTLRRVPAHRFAYQLEVGPVPDDKLLDHLCHNRAAACPGGAVCQHRRCVRPDHLEAVTNRVNLLRGKGLAAANFRKTHCPKSHPYDLLNTRVDKRGRRYCRTCERAARRERSESSAVRNGRRSA